MPPSTSNADRFINEIDDYVSQHGGRVAAYGWYVGVTDDPEPRLFGEHNVDENEDAWIYSAPVDFEIAIRTRDHFIDRGFLGDKDRPERGDLHVYAYRITLDTIE